MTYRSQTAPDFTECMIPLTGPVSFIVGLLAQVFQKATSMSPVYIGLRVVKPFNMDPRCMVSRIN